MTFKTLRRLLGASLLCSITLTGCASCEGDEPQPLDALDMSSDMPEADMTPDMMDLAATEDQADTAADLTTEPDLTTPTPCQADEFVQNNACMTCPAGTTNEAGDDTSGPDTRCDVTLCTEDERVRANTCQPCPAGATNAAGDDASGPDTRCEVTRCAEDEFVEDNTCVICPAGTTNLAGDDASGADTTCDGILCPSDTRVEDNTCVMCPAGTTNAAGDDASGADTMCDATLCSTNERVEQNVCMSCPAGTINATGDDASGPDTMCDAVLCGANEFVSNNTCMSCPEGTTNAVGDDASGPDTQCDATLCEQDEFVLSNICVECPAGSTNAAGDDASGANTACDAILCSADERVRKNTCVSCPEGTTNAAGDHASGPDTRCDITLCQADEFVQNNACVTCPAGTTNSAGDDASGADTTCDGILCPSNTRVENNTCVTCPAGSTNAAGDDASGADTMCDAVLCELDEFVENNSCVSCPAGTVNAPGDDSSGPDTQCDDACVPVFGKTCDQLQTNYLKASNVGASDQFGIALAASGDTIVVGARTESSATPTNPQDDTAFGAGAVYVFVRDPVTQVWNEQAYLKASNTKAGNNFGYAVAIEDDTIVVGAPLESSASGATPDDASAVFSGSAYVFERDPATQTWSEQAYLKASNVTAGDQFGHAVAISGDTIVIGARYEESADPSNPADNSVLSSGAAYVFERDLANSTWSQQAYLKASNVEAGDQFGHAVAISGDTIAVGALEEDSGLIDDMADNSKVDSGAVYIFERDPATQTWSEQAYLKASNLDRGDLFGFAVAISDDTLVVSTIGEDSASQSTPTDNSAETSGAAYVFERDPATQTWSEQAYLKASNIEANDQFGYAVAIQGDFIVVGAREEWSGAIQNQADNAAPKSGAAYVFERDPNTQTWSQKVYLKAFNVDPLDLFGSAVALTSTTVIVGAVGEDSATTLDPTDNSVDVSGAAYTFDL